MEREQEGRGTQLKNLVNPNLSEKASVWENIMSVPHCFSFFFLLYALLLSLQQRAHLMETSWDTSKEGESVCQERQVFRNRSGLLDLLLPKTQPTWLIPSTGISTGRKHWASWMKSIMSTSEKRWSTPPSGPGACVWHHSIHRWCLGHRLHCS